MRHGVDIIVDRLTPMLMYLRRERTVVRISFVVDPVGGDESGVIINRLNVWPLEYGLHFE